MSRRAWAGLFIFIVALGLRVAYIHEQTDKLDLDVNKLTQTDNYVFSQWARIIAEGDLLCEQQPHAYHHWTQEVAPAERWVDWYGGPKTFHQTPLYPYFVAAVYAVSNFDDTMVAYAQAFVGAFTCLLTFLLASRVLNLRAGIIAGLLLAFMSSYYFYDAFVLRDGPMAFVVILTTLALDVAVERNRKRDWLLAGASLGLFTLAKETGIPLLLATLFVMLIAWRHRPKFLMQTAALLLAGWLIVTAPAFARNVAVGAPTFKLSTRGPEVFITGNAHGQSGVGWEPPVALLRELLMESNFSLVQSMILTAGTHKGSPWTLAELLWAKTEAFLNGYEVPNNVNFYLHRSHLLSLQVGFVSMSFVAPAMLLGLILGIQKRRRLTVTYLMLGTLSLSVIALYILARFRLQVLPLMAIFAALSIDWGITRWSKRRYGSLAAALALMGSFTWWTWSHPDPYGEDSKNTSIMLQLAKTGNFEKSLYYRDRLVEVLTRAGSAQPEEEHGGKLAILQDAFDNFDVAMSAAPGTAAHHHALANGYATLIPIMKRGDLREFSLLSRENYTQAMELDETRPGVRHGLGMLLASIENHFQNEAPQKNFGGAYQWFVRELELHPDHGPSHRDIGKLHLTWEQWHTALEHLLQAEVSGTTDAESLAAIARISVDDRIRKKAQLSVYGQPTPSYDLVRGERYMRRALNMAPDDPVVLTYTSDVMYILGRYDEAIETLQRLATIQPWKEEYVRSRVDAFRIRAAREAAKLIETTPPTELELEAETTEPDSRHEDLR
jgi:4-amino-4-deoxy-L-arabinose transferase-like glycosyltransferase